MILYYVGLSAAIVWLVFHDPRIDFRALAVGDVVPDLVDAPGGGPRLGHTLVLAVAAMAVVMAATGRGSPTRRALVMLPIGMLLHLLLHGTFAEREIFWWPAFGSEFPEGGLFPTWQVAVIREVLGALALIWFLRQRATVEEAAP